MMAYRIALMVWCVSAAMGYVQSEWFFDAQNSQIDSTVASDIQSNTPGLINYSSSTSNIYIYGDFLRVLNTLGSLIKSSVLPVYMLVDFGVPLKIAILINLLCIAAYGMAIAQFLGNRSERLMR